METTSEVCGQEKREKGVLLAHCDRPTGHDGAHSWRRVPTPAGPTAVGFSRSPEGDAAIVTGLEAGKNGITPTRD